MFLYGYLVSLDHFTPPVYMCAGYLAQKGPLHHSIRVAPLGFGPIVRTQFNRAYGCLLRTSILTDVRLYRINMETFQRKVSTNKRYWLVIGTINVPM